MYNSRRGKTLTTDIPIYTLSGGVGRQAPSKRLPSEAQEMVNALCTVERSVEKRAGTDLMPIRGIDTDNSPLDSWTAEALGLEGSGPYEFFWHSLSDTARYLFVIDRTASDTADKLYYTFYFNQTEDYFEDHTQQDQTGIDVDVRAYITYGTSPLKLVTRGQNLVFLNPDVHAGYTSKPVAVTTADFIYDAYSGIPAQPAEDTTLWLEVGFDGQLKGSGTDVDPWYEDPIGLEVDYLTATKVDPEGIATYWDEYSTYITGTTVLYLGGTVVDPGGHTGHDNGLDYTEDTILNVINSTTSPFPGTHPDDDGFYKVVAFEGDGTDREPKQISVRDFEYPDSTKYQLGQSLPTFNDLTIPPLESSVLYGNNSAQDMLNALYGLTVGVDTTPADGTWDNETEVSTNSAEGKVYYIQTGYQGQAPGYYIAKSVTSPHFQKVRTPDGGSVLDAKRMPMQLEFVGGVPGLQWEWSKIEWAHRTSGDAETNPGPTPFKDYKQAKLSTIAFYRNRLWLSSGDVIFSSREGDYTDFWIEDPGLIVDTDPIDVAASTNKYTPITAMVPFNEYMFINTNADTQYELMGSENQITPFTAQLQPMTFYSTAPLIEPLTLGNNIFFYDAQRLYLYLGRGGSLSTAQELSSHCPKYLPSNFGATAVAAAQDSILAVDADSKSDVYLYSTRYRGDQILQNAFYKFEYQDREVESLRAWDNACYMVTKKDGNFFIERQNLTDDSTEIPRLDRKQLITMYPKSSALNGTDLNNPVYNGTAYNCYFDPDAVETTVRLPFVLDATKDYDFVGTDGSSYVIKEITPGATTTDIVVGGNVTQGAYWIGRAYTMLIQLSTQFLRNEQNNPREGILNIASLLTRHYKTGNYDIVVQRRGRPVSDLQGAYESGDPQLLPFKTSFAAPQSDTYANSNLGISNIEYQGELVSKIMGFSEKVEIFILSDYFTPVNITNLQIKGKFTSTYAGIL